MSLASDGRRVLLSVLRFNRFDDAVETVEVLARQRCPGLQIELVDNGSTDERTDEWFARFRSLPVVRLARNIGYAAGCNAVLERAARDGVDAVVLANPDIHVHEDAVARLLRTADAHADAGVVGGVETCYSTGRVRAVGGRPLSLFTGRVRWRTHVEPGSALVMRAHYVQGALLLVTRAALDRGVRFDERLFMYYDEPDLGLTLRARGLHAYVDRTVVVRHKGPPEDRGAKAAYYHQRNRAYLVRKHGRWWHQLGFFLLSSVCEVPAKALSRSLTGEWRVARETVRGHVDGLRGRMYAGLAESAKS